MATTISQYLCKMALAYVRTVTSRLLPKNAMQSKP